MMMKDQKKLINTIYYIYQTKGQSDTIEFIFKWYNTTGAERKIFYKKDLPDGFDIAGQIKKTNKKLFEKYKIPGTPTIFINGNKKPAQYELKDIEYFLDEINDLTRESVFATSGKRQEAQANQKPLPASHFPQQRKEVM